MKKLERSRRRRMIAGVCGGVSEYLNVDVTLIRLLMLAFILMEGAGIILYLAAWAILPGPGKEKD